MSGVPGRRARPAAVDEPPPYGSGLVTVRRLALALAIVLGCGVKSSPRPPPLGAPEPAADGGRAACTPTIAPVSESEPADAGARAP